MTEGPFEYDFGYASFARDPAFERHLGGEAFRALARRPWRACLIDRSAERRVVRAGFLAALAWMLSRRVAAWTDRRRVGIVLPPGIGAAVANLAVSLAGKVPVNLNVTLGRSTAAACLEQADLDCVLTAPSVQRKCPGFPWPETGLRDLARELQALPKARTLGLVAAMHTLPAALLAKRLGVPRSGNREEAGLLFTSGSSAEPKGVVLSHRNILANCAQIDASGLLPANETVLANLPVFHSFGFTVTLWYPMLRGCRAVALPSPLETQKIAQTVAEEGVTVLVGAPTFLKPHFKRTEPEQLRSLKYVVAGAEKTPEGFADRWESRFGSTYLEGYGLTETSPVTNVNLPGAPTRPGLYPGDPEAGRRRGSVGRMLPGHAARILDPDTREPVPADRAGLLAIRGPNVFQGYLNRPDATAEAKDGDWFVTGDLARFDADGFLYIEGRLSRFSKIGGEMVAHGAIEEALARAYGADASERPEIAVGAREDAAKGEALVVLATFEIDPADMREKLAREGFGKLWIPRRVKRVEEIPTLASGKLDLRAVREAAAEAD